jgi:hypothetical protein
MMTPFLYMTTALAFASTLGMLGFAMVEALAEVAGTSSGTKVE